MFPSDMIRSARINIPVLVIIARQYYICMQVRGIYILFSLCIVGALVIVVVVLCYVSFLATIVTIYRRSSGSEVKILTCYIDIKCGR